ncbi:transposase-like zinc-binding domain-containing protein [Shewanella sp. GXUN23E]|uniref:transposase-like zinc-binding domain-containing protein n=1 Tax=Shewanella sp. GXUN23E TaxID=3422498 RepID=UPI003D7D222E
MKNDKITSRCVHCHTGGIRKQGKHNGRQRYRCPDCLKIFMCPTKTPFSVRSESSESR